MPNATTRKAIAKLEAGKGKRFKSTEALMADLNAAIERSSAFKRDYKRAKATPRHGKDVESLVSTVVTLLLSDRALPDTNRDHALRVNWAGYRECHLEPDLLLIYSKPDAATLRLARLGSHRDLFA